MWPGQQPPGGEQNPQDQNQNPYQQPGYQQPNPYQQPGYQQHPSGQQPGYPPQPSQPGYPQGNPYQQPTVAQYAVPGPPGPVGPGDGKKKRTAPVAIVAAVAVLAAAGVAGYLVLGKDDGRNDAGGDPKPTVSAPGSGSAAASPTLENPRDDAEKQPTVPGWKVVHNPKYGTLFDVPPEWEVSRTGVITYFEDEKKGDGSPVVTMSSPAHFKSKWCAYDTDKNGTDETWGLGTAGTKGGQGAKNTDEAAFNEAGNWVWAGYAQHMPKGTIKITKAVPYTTGSGLSGSVATATAPGIKKRNTCESDGKSLAFSFKNAKGDFASFVIYAAAGVKDELPDATVRKILSTVRLDTES
ncbi:hypothetical protein [Streptomyces sp. NBC_01216]|uniref:hypothetical protein n=1 Tax=unclassified Streptomyces TaxID=2593676 RepID=UPI002E12B633|nr:hypothetical protein OG393_28705 [Streptomyces sp. NBC_01216]